MKRYTATVNRVKARTGLFVLEPCYKEDEPCSCLACDLERLIEAAKTLDKIVEALNDG